MRSLSSSGVGKVARQIIESADRSRPADFLLRQALGRGSKLGPEEATAVTRSVFAWFRWKGWLNPLRPIEAQIGRALDLDALFQANPQSIPDAELTARTIPGWVSNFMATDVAWLRALQTEPPLWLRTKAGQGAALARKLGDCRVAGDGSLGATVEYRGTRDLFRTAQFHDGEFELQDISSQAVGLVCDPKGGETWWDACAGEGGKLLHLSDLMGNRGLIWASDRAEWRLKVLKRRTARARVFNYRAVQWDGGPKLPTKTKFDGVLVDAPCSGIGTWHRNPHARWTTEPRDIEELSAVQRELLLHAAASVKPGGKLVYSVCTLSKAETSDVAAAFEAGAPGWKRLAIANPLDPVQPAVDELWLWPQQCRGNGMFVAAWTRL